MSGSQPASVAEIGSSPVGAAQNYLPRICHRLCLYLVFASHFFVLVGGQVAGQATPPVTPPVEVLARLLKQAGELGNAEMPKARP